MLVSLTALIVIGSGARTAIVAPHFGFDSGLSAGFAYTHSDRYGSDWQFWIGFGDLFAIRPVYYDPCPVIVYRPRPVLYYDPCPVIVYKPHPLAYYDPCPIFIYDGPSLAYRRPIVVYDDWDDDEWFEPAPMRVAFAPARRPILTDWWYREPRVVATPRVTLASFDAPREKFVFTKAKPQAGKSTLLVAEPRRMKAKEEKVRIGEVKRSERQKVFSIRDAKPERPKVRGKKSKPKGGWDEPRMREARMEPRQSRERFAKFEPRTGGRDMREGRIERVKDVRRDSVGGAKESRKAKSDGGGRAERGKGAKGGKKG